MREHPCMTGAIVGLYISVWILASGFRLPPWGHREADYARTWAAANGGELEHRLPDGTRVDILTAAEAIEVEFAEKWSEAIGQALYYAAATGRRPAVVLIVRGPQDAKYRARIERVSERWALGLTVYSTAR